MCAVRQNLPGALDAKCSVWAVEDGFGHAEVTASAGPLLAKCALERLLGGMGQMIGYVLPHSGVSGIPIRWSCSSFWSALGELCVSGLMSLLTGNQAFGIDLRVSSLLLTRRKAKRVRPGVRIVDPR